MTMKVIESPSAMTEWSRQVRLQQQRIGLVPTMGYLHEGHLSLIRLAKKNSDRVVVSIFVNPTQFAPGEDFERYPRDFDHDREACRQEEVDIIFYPAADDMYKASHHTLVSTGALAAKLCGASRPTHFQGVTTIVAKLFNIVQPDVAVFGQKDAQQSLIIRRMVADLNFPLQIIVAPIVREEDGLAMSSRNKYLTGEQRQEARVMYRSLQQAGQLIQAGEREAGQVRQNMLAILERARGMRLDYLAIVDFDNLEPVEKITPHTLIALAAYFGTTRLIDNILID
jgi:pantoate--beta-alanine ligase